MQVVYEKNRDFQRISGFRMDHCWIVACDQHLNDPVQLIHHVSVDSVGATNKTNWRMAVLIMDSPGGYRPSITFLERSRRADGKT